MFFEFPSQDVLKVEGIMDICEHRDAETKPLIFCVVARDGMPSKAGKTRRCEKLEEKILVYKAV